MANNKTNNKNTTKKKNSYSSAKKTGKRNTSGTQEVIEGIGKWELASFVFGFLLIVASVFLLASFCSYLFTGEADYSLLESGADLANEAGQYKNVCGSWGANVAYFFLNKCFGLASFVIPIYMIILGFRMMRIYRVKLLRKFILMGLLLIWTSVFLAFIGQMLPISKDSFLNPGGYHGQNVVRLISNRLGNPGVLAVLIVTGVFYLMYVSVKTVEYIRDMFRLKFIKNLRNRREEDEEDEEDDEDTITDYSMPENDTSSEKEDVEDDNGTLVAEGKAGNAVTFDFGDTSVNSLKAGSEKNDKDDDDIGSLFDQAYSRNNNGQAGDDGTDNTDMKIEVTQTEKGDGNINRGDINTPYDPKLDLEYYKYPTLDLIHTGAEDQQAVDPVEQNSNKDRIIQVLHTFGVEISSIKATIGPTITLYEIVPAEGVRITKIRNLEDDIALSLAAEGIRIIAPIPGKGTIGIEVPNKKKCIVSMESVLNSKVYQESTMDLPCAIGKTITNEVFMFDLTKAPHLLVAGATGQGKSVGLNAIIASLLYKKHPAELKIVMIDPKKVEFSVYTPIENHFLARLEEEDDCIITDVQKVVKTLNSLCQLMDSRYDLLKKAGCRNIKEYNTKFKARKLNPEDGHEFMPYIVVVVDEFGDLIMTAGKEVELPICRIAQLARAVGIHMIIATQRPQANIISGAIKTNFPARMAFKVSSMIDSRVILDRPGAQQLIGRGDMLFLSGSDPIRVQSAFIDTPEVGNVCQFIAKQQSYLHPMFLPEVVVDGGDEGVAGRGMDVKHLDPLFAEVAKFVVNSQQGSTSMIQRNYSIGYNRAGKIMDQLERMGVVGSQIGSKPREVLIKDPLTLEGLLNTLG